MSLDDLKNEVLTTLKVCKRHEEAEEVIGDAHQKLLAKEVARNQRYLFWKEIYEKLGERIITQLEEETDTSVDPIITMARDRIERILEKEKSE
ncbi:hypothetical protein [Rhodohalobacter sp. 614A]|uniref:hypothetical protein n=1 Tax=Rhodohalobacter sp. 614A TaxID=2908649 RepID=UPI001F32D664|nr:hypothetical protein [Rhodohalobacter sp. 614A]